MGVIHNAAARIGSSIQRQTGVDKNVEEIYVYFFERLLNNALLISLLLIISSLFDIQITTFIVYFTYLPLRTRFGGIHVENDWLCLFITVVVMTLAGYIASVINATYIFIIMVYIFAYFTAFKIGVVDNKKKPLTREQKKKFFKEGIILLTITIVINFVLYYYSFTKFSVAISIAVIIAMANLYFGEK